MEERRKYPTVKLLDTTATSYIAHGLQKFSDYNITMRLFNDKGHGPWSKPVFVRTSEDCKFILSYYLYDNITNLARLKSIQLLCNVLQYYL